MYFSPKGKVDITEREIVEGIYKIIEAEVYHTIHKKVREETIRFLENKGLDPFSKNACDFESFLDDIREDMLYNFLKHNS